MTVETNTNFVTYQGNGATTVWPFPFLVFEEEDLVITLSDFTTGALTHTYLPGEFIITGLGVETGGSVTILGTPITSASRLIIERLVDYTQELDLVNQAGFYPEEIERQLDRTTMQIQQLANIAGRALTVPLPETGLTLPNASERANKYMVFGPTGDTIFMSEGTGADGGLRGDIGGPNGGSMIGMPGGGSLTDYVNWLTPEAFGAKGAPFDDTVPFQSLSLILNTLGFGAVQFKPGRTYLCGKQNANTDGRRWAAELNFHAYQLDWLVIDGQGAKMQFNPGMYFGGFDAANNPTVAIPNVNVAQQANQGLLMYIQECDRVFVKDLNFEGDAANVIVGGPWGDTGRQCTSYGFYIGEWQNAVIINVHARNFALDGMAQRHHLQPLEALPTPIIWINCSTKQNGRNSMSIVGGNHNTFEECDFRDGGYAPNAYAGGPGYIISSPASCCDVEAESAAIRRTRFSRCNFIGNAQTLTAFVADSGDTRGVEFDQCTFDGHVWTAKPETIFYKCVVNGKFLKLLGGQALPRWNTQLIKCSGSDTPQWSAKSTTGLFMDMGGSGASVEMHDITFYLQQTRLNWAGAYIRRAHVTLAFGTNTAVNQDYAVLAGSANSDFEKVTFVDATGSAAGDFYPNNEGVFISAAGLGRAVDCNIVAKASYTLKWNSWSPGGGGYPQAAQTDGSYDKGVGQTFEKFRMQKNSTFGGGLNGWIEVAGSIAVPVFVAQPNGSFAFHTDAALNEPAMWVNVGGVFQPVGIVGQTRAAAPTTTYVAPAGGATIDAQARASLAQLAVDLADLKTKLATARTTA